MPRLILVTRRTRLQELVERYNTREQARFYVEHMGLDFSDYEREHATQLTATEQIEQSLQGLADRVEHVDRTFLSTFLFRPDDIAVVVGQDGLVVNLAKYLDGQPIVAVNPDAARWEGVLLPFRPAEVREVARRTLDGNAHFCGITMAEARLNDGQALFAVNDFLIGARTHVSARYRLRWREQEEVQSSSGVLVSTGAGSTGWFSSIQNMATSVSGFVSGHPTPIEPLRLGWDDPRLVYAVREPYASRSTGTGLVAGLIEPGASLCLESLMPEGGVIFSDGVESDALNFNAGAVVTIRRAERQTRLVVPRPGWKD